MLEHVPGQRHRRQTRRAVLGREPRLKCRLLRRLHPRERPFLVGVKRHRHQARDPASQVGKIRLRGVRPARRRFPIFECRVNALALVSRDHTGYSAGTAVAKMLPRHDAKALAFGVTGQVIGQRRNGPRDENAHRRRNRADEFLEPPRQLIGILGTFQRAHPFHGKPIPVGLGSLVARVEVADIAKQPGKCDQVLQAPAREWPRWLRGGARRVGLSLQREIVDPRRGCPRHDDPQNDQLGVLGNVPHDLVLAPRLAADRPVIHVIEEPGSPPLPIHPQPELRSIEWPAGVYPHRRLETNHLPPVRRRVDLLKQD